MPQTYHQLTKHIAELQAQAEGVKRAEVGGVIAKAKEAIRVYGLTQLDLFDAKTTRATQASKVPKGKQAKSSEAKYADGKGGVWVGRGKRPRWLSDLLNGGAKLEDFLASKGAASAAVTAVADSSKPPAARKGAAKKASTKAAAKKAAKAKYQDGTGNSWGGFGPRPKWLKDALAGGKKLEDFLG
jgi:DNA-binding protein H-NS